MRRFKSSSVNIRWGFVAAIIIGGLVLSSICLGYSGGAGTAEEPYRIASKADLLELAGTTTDYNKCFILTADVNMEGQVFARAIIAADTNSNSGFQGTAFSGAFDGNDHKIVNFTINGASNNYLGLFGCISSSSVKNLGLDDVTIEGHNISGILAGYNDYGTISNCYTAGLVTGNAYNGGLVGCNDNGEIAGCYSSASVYGANCYGGLVGENYKGSISDCCSTGDVNGSATVGGLVGLNNDGSISNCYSRSNVVGSSGEAGGLVGYNSNNGIISDCSSSGTVSGISDAISIAGLAGANAGNISRCYSTGTVSGYWRIGGLLGYNRGNISDCYSKGNVNGYNDVGGLVGFCYENGSISNCYSTGNVSGISQIGGLVGFCISPDFIQMSITNSYSTGTVSGTSDVGGLVGSKGTSSVSIIGCYFLDTAGPNNGYGEPLTDGQMKQQRSFVGWDFVGEVINGPNDIWKICEGTNYPKLSWQIPLTGDFVCPDGVDFYDFAVLADQWLLEELSFDVWPSGGDGIVNLCDWAIFANQWQIAVNYESLADFAKQWLKTGTQYCVADIAPDDGDGIVNMLDLAVFANNWLEGL